MNRVLFVLASNIHWAPYYFRYEKVIKELNIPFDLLLWNREGIKESAAGSIIEFNVNDKTSDGNKKKIIKFFQFSKFVKKQLVSYDYKAVVFLGTYACVPALISRFLKKHYLRKYWIDLRDITYENFLPFYSFEKTAIIHSYKTVISSKGFIPFLPKYSYDFIHNIDPTMDDIYKLYKKTTSDVIRICYIGNIGYWDSCKQMIDILSNDRRFKMYFIGPNYEFVEKYCLEREIQNVSFHGMFKRDETVFFYNNCDLIYNLYGNENTNVRTALSNKLYYGIRFSIPLLVNSNTYMETIVKKYNIGITFENNDSFPNKLYDWLKNFNNEKHLFEEAWNDFKREDLKAIRDFETFMKETNFEKGFDSK